MAQLFLLCALMALTVIVHSFVADSGLYYLRFSDVCFFHFMLTSRPPFFGVFFFFEVISAVLFLSFGVSCLLA